MQLRHLKHSRHSCRPVIRPHMAAFVLPVVVGLLLATPVQAQRQFTFADETLLQDAMQGLVAKFSNSLSAHPVASGEACHLTVINDRHASRPFDDETQQQINDSMLDAFAAAAHVSHCDMQSRELSAGEELAELLASLRAEGKDGLVLIVSYYPEPGGVMTFAKLEDTDGNLFDSSGRYDLPVVETAAAAQAPAPTAAAETPSVLRIAGSSELGQHLMPELAKGFLKLLIFAES